MTTLTVNHRSSTYEKYVGRRFGRWTVVDLAGKKNNTLHLLARCDCGTEREVPARNLKNRLSTQCWKCGNRSAAKSRVAKTEERRTGERIGKCTVLGREQGRWLLRCDCGKEFFRTALVSVTQCVPCGQRANRAMKRMTLREAGDVLGVSKEAVRVYLNRHGEDAVMARVDAVRRGEPDPVKVAKAASTPRAPRATRTPKQSRYAAEQEMVATMAPGTAFVWKHGLQSARQFAHWSRPGVRSLVSGGTVWIVYVPDIGATQ